MLDTFEIFTTSGVVLWSRTYAAISPSVINSFIEDVFIEEKSEFAQPRDGASAAENPPYKHDQHTLRWTLVKELGIIFVVRTSPRPYLPTAPPKLTRRCAPGSLSVASPHLLD